MQNNFYFTGQFTNIYKKSSKFSEVTSQILYGEKFKILSKNKSWIKIKSSFDNYIGYIKNNKYESKLKLTHKIFKLKANIFSKPNHKTKNFLPFGSKFSIINETKNYVKFEKNKWLKKKDIKKIDHINKNYIKIFKLFLETKYIWGGKTYNGIDCSALIQVFFNHNNKYCPRDSKDQERYFKKKVELKNIKKNDMIFWKGHVAIALSKKKLIHAYGPMKKTVIMDINKTIKRIDKTAKLKVTGIKRL